MASYNVDVRSEMSSYRERGYFYHSSGMDTHLFNGRSWRRYVQNEKRTETQGLTTVIYVDQADGTVLDEATYQAKIDEQGRFWRSTLEYHGETK